MVHKWHVAGCVLGGLLLLVGAGESAFAIDLGVQAPVPIPASKAQLVDITSPNLTPFWAETIGAVVGDFNNDGSQDFFAIQRGFEAKLFTQTPGTGVFKDSTTAYFPLERGNWSTATSAVRADFDEDGRPDILIGTSGVGGTYSGSNPSVVALQPRLYLSSGVGLGVEPSANAANGWRFASQADLDRIFSEAVSTIAGQRLGSGLDQVLALAVADLDGDGFPEILNQTRNEARVYWSPNFDGVASVVEGTVDFDIDARFRSTAQNNPSNHTRADWEVGDDRTFKPGDLIWIIRRSDGKKWAATVREYKLDAGGIAVGIRVNLADFPSELLNPDGTVSAGLRVRARGKWVVRRFKGTFAHRSAAPRITVSDLNGDGRAEVLVAEGSAPLHRADCSQVAGEAGEAFLTGRLHVYGLNPGSLEFVDWMREGQGQQAEEVLEAFQKRAATTRSVVAVDVNRDGVRDLILLPGARSPEERLGILMDSRGIPNQAPVQGAGAVENELYTQVEAGRSDCRTTQGYFARDRHGQRNDLPKILLSQVVEGGQFSFQPVDQAQIADYLPDEFLHPLDVQSAVVVRDRDRFAGEVDRLLVAAGFSVAQNKTTVLSYPVNIGSAGPRAIGRRLKCGTSRGDEVPLASLFPGLIVEDMNGDGVKDLLHLPVGQGAVHVGNGGGCYFHQNRLPLDPRFVSQLQKVDINQDGLPDLVGSIDADTLVDWVGPYNRPVLYLNTRNGNFVDASSFLTIPDATRPGGTRTISAKSVVVLDANRDSLPDLLVFGNNSTRGHPVLGSNGVYLLLNRGAVFRKEWADYGPVPQFEPAPDCLPALYRNWDAATQGGSPHYRGMAADLNLDGADDVVLLKNKGNPDILFSSMIRGGFNDECRNARCTARDIQAGACTRLLSASEDLQANTQANTQVAYPLLTLDALHTGRSNRMNTLAVTDLNGDHKPDIIVGAPAGPVAQPVQNGPFNAIFMNRISTAPGARFPVGAWTNWLVQPPAGLADAIKSQEGARCIAAADFDGDRRKDLLMVGPGECSAGGDGYCQNTVEAGKELPPFPQDRWSYRAWGKVLLNSTPNGANDARMTVNVRAGAAVEEDLSSYPGTASYDCSVGDFNGDGCSDLFIVGYGFGNVNSRSYGPSSGSGGAQKWYQQALMSSVYLNSCHQTPGVLEFTRVKAQRNPFKAYSVSVGDFDGDGKDEAVVGGANQMHLFEVQAISP